MTLRGFLFCAIAIVVKMCVREFILHVINFSTQWRLHNCWQHNRGNYTSNNLSKKKQKKYSGVHPRVSTLIQPSFQKKAKCPTQLDTGSSWLFRNSEIRIFSFPSFPPRCTGHAPRYTVTSRALRLKSTFFPLFFNSEDCLPAYLSRLSNEQ